MRLEVGDHLDAFIHVGLLGGLVPLDLAQAEGMSTLRGTAKPSFAMPASSTLPQGLRADERVLLHGVLIASAELQSAFSGQASN
jgi:hypothetical protein